MKLYYSLACLLLLHSYAFAQAKIKLDWLASAASYYNGGKLIVEDIATISDGSVVAVGNFTNTVDFDPGPDTFSITSSGVQDIFIVKYSKTGKLVYAYDFGGYDNHSSEESGYGIAVDDEGNAYMTGTFGKTIDFDPGEGKALLTAGNSTEIFVASYDKAGRFRYAINLADTKASNIIQSSSSIVVDKQKNVYVTGTFDGFNIDFDPGTGSALLSTSGLKDIFFAKYDSSGKYVFAKDLGGNDKDYGNKIILDSNKNIILTGQFTSPSIDLDPGTGIAIFSCKGKDDFFFAKYDSLGNYLFAQSIGGSQNDVVKSVAVGKDNSIALTGVFASKNVDFDASTNTHLLSAVGYDNTYVARYDQHGNYVFAFAIGVSGGAYSVDAGMDSSNNIFVTGYLYDVVTDFDPGNGMYKIPNAKYGDMFIAKYTSQGSFLFAESIGNKVSIVKSMTINSQGNVLISGFFSGLLDVDPGIGITNIYAPALTLFIARYTNNGNYASSLSTDNYHNYYNATTSITASATDNAGNVYITGYYNGRYDFDPGSNVYILESLNDYNYSSYFAKYNSKGQLVFAKSLTGVALNIHAIAIDKYQNIYFGGHINGDIDFDPSDSVRYLNNSKNPKSTTGYFFAKYDKTGALVFSKGAGNSYYGTINDLAIDNYQNIYVTGFFNDSLDFDPGLESHLVKALGEYDIFYAKYDASGNFLFANTIGVSGGYNSGNKIKLNSKDDIIICGKLNGNSVDFDSGINQFLLSSQYNSGFVASYKNNGTFNYAFPVKSATDYSEVDMNSLTLNASDDVYITGNYNGPVDFDPGSKTAILPESSGFFFASYKKSGQYKFVKGISKITPSNSAFNNLSSITVDNSNNIYVTGEFGSKDIDCDPGPDTAILTNEHYDAKNGYHLDIFFAKYDSLGNYLYSYDFNGDSAFGSNHSTAIATDKKGNIYYTGYCESKIDFDPGPDSTFLIPTSTSLHENLFIAKYSPLPLAVKQSNNISSYTANKVVVADDANSNLIIYPNPVKDRLYLSIKETNATTAGAKIYNTQGVCIGAMQLPVINNSISTSIVLPPGLAKGNYFINITTGSKQYKASFIIQ